MKLIFVVSQHVVLGKIRSLRIDDPIGFRDMPTAYFPQATYGRCAKDVSDSNLQASWKQMVPPTVNHFHHTVCYDGKLTLDRPEK